VQYGSGGVPGGDGQAGVSPVNSGMLPAQRFLGVEVNYT
jgi:hypothetical protein